MKDCSAKQATVSRQICGSSDLELPVLGIGCWSFGGGSYWGTQEQYEVDAVVAAALEAGCVLFDTAEVYNEGRSEVALGRALKGRRPRALIATKVSPHHTYPSTLRAHCDGSLRRLGTDYIDLYMVHWPICAKSMPHFTDSPEPATSPPDVREAFDTLVSLREQGKIRYIGVSNHGPAQLHEIADYPVIADQLCYNLLSRGIEFELLQMCKNMGIGILAYMPLLQGVLTGKYLSLENVPAPRARTRHFRGDRVGSRHNGAGFESEMTKCLSALKRLSDDSGVSMLELSLGWTIANPAIACTLVGVRSIAQLNDSLAVAHRPLPPPTVRRLNEITDPLKNMMGASIDLFESTENTRIL